MKNTEELFETPPSEALAPAQSTKNPLRKLYFWTLHWADHKYAIPFLFFISFIESSFFPIPPDVLLMAICFSRPKRWLQAALWCTVGSVLGGVFGWYIGWGLWEVVGLPIVKFYHGEAIMGQVKVLYTTYGFWGILIAAITPIPYKVFTIASGVFQYDVLQLVIASILGRGFRFFLVAGMIRVFGENVRKFIETRLELCMIAGTISGIGGIMALKFLR
jgi:membrane protein YqaA with SNARE-associated domain